MQAFGNRKNIYIFFQLFNFRNSYFFINAFFRKCSMFRWSILLKILPIGEVYYRATRKRIPQKNPYILGNETFLYFRKGIRTLTYLEL